MRVDVIFINHECQFNTMRYQNNLIIFECFILLIRYFYKPHSVYHISIRNGLTFILERDENKS